MSQALKNLLTLLNLEKIEEGLFRGQSEDLGLRQVFGGQVVGPGSRTSDGEYRIVSEATQAVRIPDWLLDVLLDNGVDRDHSMTTPLLDEHVSALPDEE